MCRTAATGTSGVAAAAALNMLDEAAPPKKKQRAITKTEMRRVEIRTLLKAGTPLPQIAKQLDCCKGTILNVMRMLEKESQQEGNQSYSLTKRSLAVKAGPGRPRHRTPGL